MLLVYHSFAFAMSFVSTYPSRAKGLGISVQEVQELKSLPRLPSEITNSTTKDTWETDFKSKKSSFWQDLLRFQSDTWAFEILSLLISLAALLLAAAALRYYDGKSAPDWPYSLTLNAFISVCMTIMVASLTVAVSGGLGQLKWIRAREGGITVMELDNLDRASRGLWGSVCALFTRSGG